jgi:DeoR family transcriptional regulator of aga operon
VAAVKRALLKAAASKRLLVDSSKFRPRTFMRVASVTELDEVIADDGMPREEIERMRALGVKLTLVGVSR